MVLAKNLPNSNLVEITEKDYNVIFDIKYATTDNFSGTAVYKASKVFLHKDIAEKLKVAVKLAGNLGYTIKIYDGFRPLEVQKYFFYFVNDERYVTDPEKGLATHTRGIAIDCSLVDSKTKKDLDFGTPFDDFTEDSHQGVTNISVEAQKNRAILSGIMSMSGFSLFMTEWWHFQVVNIFDYPKLTQKEANLDIMSDIVETYEYKIK